MKIIIVTENSSCLWKYKNKIYQVASWSRQTERYWVRVYYSQKWLDVLLASNNRSKCPSLKSLYGDSDIGYIYRDMCTPGES